MRITAPSAIVIFAGLAVAAKQTDNPYVRIAKMASFISDGQVAGALEAFDKNSLRYAAIAEQLEALAAQNEVLCSIDVVEDREADNEKADVHHLDLDWYMTLKSRSDAGLVERRRTRVAVTIEREPLKSGTVWRITSLSPESILAPITIH